MQEQDTINILVSQLLSKEDELLRLRKDNERLRDEQREGNRQILENKVQAEKESVLLSRVLEELKTLRAAELFEIEKQNVSYMAASCRSLPPNAKFLIRTLKVRRMILTGAILRKDLAGICPLL